MRRLLLVGASEHGRVVADMAELLGFESIAFVDDRWPELSHNQHWSVIGTTEQLGLLRDEYPTALVSIGANRTRLRLHRRLVELSFTVPTLIHPSAVVSRYARLGAGAVVLANVVVGSFATIGEAVVLNTASTVDHDCVLRDGAHIAPGAHLAGKVTVGECSWIGIGAAVRESTMIGSDAMIGAGSVVVTDIRDGAIAMGVPARSRN